MGTEVRRTYSGSIDFTAVQRERTLALDPAVNIDLLDVELVAFVQPGMDARSPGGDLLGGQDYRLFLNEHDVSSVLIQSLQASLASIPATRVAEQYLAGATAYLDFVDALGIRKEETKNDRGRAKVISQSSDWPAQMDKLGDRNVGWGGNLHPLNFVYRFIELPPISLQEIWGRFAQGDPALPGTLSALPLKTITITQGPWAKVERFDATQHQLHGTLAYQLDVLYENPLKKPLEVIARRIRDIQKDLESLRTQYMEPAVTTLETVDNDVDKLNQSLEARLKQLTDTVNQIA